MNHNGKKILQIVGLSVFFLFLVFYVFSRSKDLLFGVKIENVNIEKENGKKFNNDILEITGNAKNAIKLTLNGREISIDVKGDFNETIALLSGYNTVNITAKDKFGYVDEKNFRLIGGFAGEAK